MYRERQIRHWDPEGRFEGAALRLYEHWALEVSWQQHTLGCYIIFCRREGVRLQSELTDQESVELKKVMGEIETALRKPDFSATHFNYWQMGNALPLLHFHGIPRYDTHRELAKTLLNRDLTDPTPTHLPLWTSEKVTSEQMGKLRDAMHIALGDKQPDKQPSMAPRENPFYPGIRKAIDSL
ncbi:MAG: hypothetical protein ABIO72_00530 [Patescibacteria group bacterium]